MRELATVCHLSVFASWFGLPDDEFFLRGDCRLRARPVGE